MGEIVESCRIGDLRDGAVCRREQPASHIDAVGIEITCERNAFRPLEKGTKRRTVHVDKRGNVVDRYIMSVIERHIGLDLLQFLVALLHRKAHFCGI